MFDNDQEAIDGASIHSLVQTSGGCPTQWTLEANVGDFSYDVSVHYRHWRLSIKIDGQEFAMKDFSGISDGCASWEEVEPFVLRAVSAFAENAAEV